MVKVEEIPNGYFIRVTENEALELITSLTEQIISGTPNVGRTEFSNPYFTVAVEHTIYDSVYSNVVNILNMVDKRSIVQFSKMMACMNTDDVDDEVKAQNMVSFLKDVIYGVRNVSNMYQV